MPRRNITKESQRTIDEAIIELTFGRYAAAEQKFESVVDDLRDRLKRHYGATLFHMYSRTAAFGQGLAEGMAEYDESNTSGEPRRVWEVAEAAKHFYDHHANRGDLRVGNAAEDFHRLTGKHYALLGLGKEGLEVLEDSRHSKILHWDLFETEG